MTPLNTFGLVNVNPGLELSCEYRHSQLSTQITASFLTDLTGGLYKSSFRGYKVAVEEKYFFSPAMPYPYLSMEAMFMKVNYTTSSEFTKDTIRSSPRYWDFFDVDKHIATLTVKYGYQIFLDHFVIDLFAGLG